MASASSSKAVQRMAAESLRVFLIACVILMGYFFIWVQRYKKIPNDE
jgi:hypothetical protein